MRIPSYEVIPLLDGLVARIETENWPIVWSVCEYDELADGGSSVCLFQCRQSKKTLRYLLTTSYSIPSFLFMRGKIEEDYEEIRQALTDLLHWLQNELYGPSNLNGNNIVIAMAWRKAMLKVPTSSEEML